MNKKLPAKSNRFKDSAYNYLFIWITLGVILLLNLITFFPAIHNEFTDWDDQFYVTENRALAMPLFEAVKYFFTHLYFANYSPVTLIAYAFQFHSAGLNPLCYHVVNIFIHLLNVLLVFYFIYLISGKRLEVAAIVALFFGVHPMHVESVAWIAELKDVLYSFFFILGLIFYFKYIIAFPNSKSIKSGSFLLLILSFILFVLSVLSKPTAVTFPLILLLIDFYTKRRFNKYVWFEKLPFFIVSIIIGLISFKSEQQVHAINDSYTIAQKLLFANYSFVVYIVKIFLPVNLSVVYPYPHINNGHLPYVYYVTPVIAILILLLIYKSYKGFYKNELLSAIFFGFLFFFINIALMLKFVSFSVAILAERYTYVPYIGLLFIIAMLFSKVYNTKDVKLSWLKFPSLILMIVLAIACCMLSNERCKVWKNNDSLWTDALNKYPDSPIALNNKGIVLCGIGQYDEAINLFNNAIHQTPDFGDVYLNLAECYYRKHDVENAIKNIDIALKYIPDYYKAYNDKGIILTMAGNYLEAIKFFQKAIQLYPLYGQAYFNVGICYSNLKDFDNAILYGKKSLRLNPENANSYKFLAWAYQNKGINDSAEVYNNKANEFNRAN